MFTKIHQKHQLYEGLGVSNNKNAINFAAADIYMKYMANFI